ncbi:riboflavin synthase [Thalassotalea sp. HSM 43]|uniref:riboflavin synthase n=1 Tax=Thalassotalea sp. HSM 43 TaxID=2552945 RepID=UPI0010801C9B|nr:riboflavin synthase [Thalassotalea sp. HSM 43]QBY05194.1 riboflavin synthase [Thalassotalea sp. HSM 43]
MFTGIIEAIGSIASISVNSQGARIKVNVGKLDMSDVKLGDSIATNGICLTVVDYDKQSYSADVSMETLKRTGFAHYQAGDKVNLEKAMLPTTRFGGHIVSGHVDGVATIQSIQQVGNATEYWLELPHSLKQYAAEKGSITVDGTSLTINSVADNQFRLTIVPHTIEETIISSYQVGSQVNLEVDVVARYLERLLFCQNESASKTSGVTEELLINSGFMKG